MIPRAERRFLDWCAILLTPWLILLQGHRFGVGNHDTLLSFLRRLHDPYYLASDYMMSTPPVHPQLLDVMLPLVSSWGENGAFLLLHIAARLFLLMGIWRLCMALVPGRPWVAVAAMLGTLAEPRLQLGAHYLQGGHFEPAFLGMAAAVWTLAIGIRFARGESHWMSLALAAGFGFFSHLFIGGPIFVVVFAVTFLLGRRDFAWIFALLGALFLGSITWLPALTGFLKASGGSISGEQVIQLLQFRHPHHHQPWTWPLIDFIQAGVFLSASAWAWWNLTPPQDRNTRLGIPGGLLLWFALTCAAFTVFGLIQKVPILAYLQPFRLLSLLLMMGLIASLEAARRTAAAISWWGQALVLGAVLLMFRLEALVPLAVYTIWCVKRPVASSELAGWIPRRRWLAVGAFVGFAGIMTLQRHDELRDFANRLRREHWLVDVAPQDPARRELAAWIRTHTPGSALFAIPPGMEGFRIWERRAIVVDYKNVPYRAPDLAEWAERIALAANVDPYIPFIAPPETDANPWQMALLATTYGARYVVLREPVEDRTVVFRNSVYTVLDLERAQQVNLMGITEPR